MCGIAGVLQHGSTPVHLNQLKLMADAAAHRGPDDAGFFSSGSVGLAHRRLSIIDLRDGHQPMSNEDDSIWIVFNGEIYNHRELRAGLESRGHRYKTNSDTETIIHAYEEYGKRCVNHLRGMFAFAIWNSRSRELFLARDRLGIKPLYYVRTDDGSLYFASEIKCLLAGSAIKPQVNYSALPDYLANRATSGKETLFHQVNRLLPGHTLVCRDGDMLLEQYWHVSFPQDAVVRCDPHDCVQRWAGLFRESIALHLVSDVPLGVFLSGGIDSSAICAVMSQLVRDPIQTFSVAFAEREANELDYARLVAHAFHSDHHEIIVRPESFFSVLPKLVWYEDEPLAGPASVPLYFVSSLASQHVKVVLTGEGSDELLGGYDRYRKTVYNLLFGAGYHRMTNEWIRNKIRCQINGLGTASKIGRKLSRTFLCIPTDIESIYFDNFAVFSRAMQHDLLTTETKERLGTLDPHRGGRRYLEESDASTLLNRLLDADINTYLHELLMKQDQMSMAASIESRVPFLDHHLVEFTARLPEDMKLRRWTTKYILRQSMRGLLPDVIRRRAKMGFPTPIGAWFRGRFRWVLDEYVLSERATARGLFEQTFVRDLVNQHQSGIREHSERLWSLVNLEIWLRQFIEGEYAKEPQPALSDAVAVIR
jgi:asparagine synthase (glutamine-hydrolysing)